jgi:hypothetical protein
MPVSENQGQDLPPSSAYPLRIACPSSCLYLSGIKRGPSSRAAAWSGESFSTAKCLTMRFRLGLLFRIRRGLYFNLPMIQQSIATGFERDTAASDLLNGSRSPGETWVLTS